MPKKKPRQLEFDFKSWGGPRKGAGRKPRGRRPGVSHRTRAPLASRFPVHVTVRLTDDLPSLRRDGPRRVLLKAFVLGREYDGFRLIHYSIQSNHLHLIVEAVNRDSLSRGMQGLLVRVARGLNRLWNRRGSVIGDRYQSHILKTPREVRNALCYVLHNAKKHRVKLGAALDPFASGGWFDGWRGQRQAPATSPLAKSHTWLLTTGWRRHGLIDLAEAPRGSPP